MYSFFVGREEMKSKKFLLEDFMSGDIITVCYKPSLISIVAQGFSLLDYTHPIIIFEKDYNRYALELMEYDFDPSISQKSGKREINPTNRFHIISLEKWIKINRKHDMLLVRIKNMGLEKEYLDDYIYSYYQKNKDIKLIDEGISRYLRSESEYKDIQNGNDYLCYESIFNIYVELGIFEKMSLRYIRPDFKNIKMKDGVYLEKTIIEKDMIFM
jgi:hypothetical protein